MILSGRAIFWGTPLTQFIPWWTWAWETIAQGVLPVWNEMLGMGAPLIANYQSALFYPPTWLYFLLYSIGGISTMAWFQAVIVVLHLSWASFGMALLIRQLRLGILAQVIGGMAFGMSGYLVSRAGFLSINAAVAWLPWIILGVTRLIEEGIASIGDGATVEFGEKDKDLFTPEAISSIESHVTRSLRANFQLEFRCAGDHISSGIIVRSKDGRAIIDNSFSNRLKGLKAELRGEVAEILLQEQDTIENGRA